MDDVLLVTVAAPLMAIYGLFLLFRAPDLVQVTTRAGRAIFRSIGAYSAPKHDTDAWSMSRTIDQAIEAPESAPIALASIRAVGVIWLVLATLTAWVGVFGFVT